MKKHYLTLLGILLAAAASLTCASSSNLLPNGDFSVRNQLSGWTVEPGSLGEYDSVIWNNDDADGNANSGSIEFDTYFGPIADSACFAVTPGAAYTYGGYSRNPPSMNAAGGILECRTFPEPDCVGTPTQLSSYAYVNMTSSWSPLVPASGTLPDTAQSAICHVAASAVLGLTKISSVRFDNLYFMTDDIFSDGFESH